MCLSCGDIEEAAKLVPCVFTKGETGGFIYTGVPRTSDILVTLYTILNIHKIPVA
jgi:hypothetical protein